MTERLLEAHDFWPISNDGHEKGISVTVEAGQLFSVIGPDTDNISSWLKAFAGIEAGSSGSLYLLGENPDDLDKLAWQKLRTRIAYLDTQTRLLSVHSVLENIVLPALYHKVDRREVLIAKAKELLAMMDEPSQADLNELPAYVDQFSYIQAVIVRALMLKPRIIIIDSLFKTLTRQASQILIQFLIKIANQENISLIVHGCDVEDYVQHSDIILFIMKNRVLEFQGYEHFMLSSQSDVKTFLRENYID